MIEKKGKPRYNKKDWAAESEKNAVFGEFYPGKTALGQEDRTCHLEGTIEFRPHGKRFFNAAFCKKH